MYANNKRQCLAWCRRTLVRIPSERYKKEITIDKSDGDSFAKRVKTKYGILKNLLCIHPRYSRAFESGNKGYRHETRVNEGNRVEGSTRVEDTFRHPRQMMHLP